MPYLRTSGFRDRTGLNREPWFAILGILEFVGVPRQPSNWSFLGQSLQNCSLSLGPGCVRIISKKMTREQNEKALVSRIERTFRSPKSKALVLGLGDDAALWSPTPGCETILTCDWFLEGTHFLRDKHPADAVGWKALARATSDIAAMGGTPQCFLLNLALPVDLTGPWLTEFLGGVRRASKKFGCVLAGGDTTRGAKVLIDITVVGEVKHGPALLRSGARTGDGIFVSGTLGEAELGLRQLKKQKGLARITNAALRKHLYPPPRLALGQWLAAHHLPTAMMDLSDGLSADLPRLCAASRVGARIEANSLPLTQLAKPFDAIKLALDGGDDYELLFTVSARNVARIPSNYHGLRLTRIGGITREGKILLESAAGKLQPLRSGGWDPFRKS
jgi:thiamine-monophosphate kinase